MPPASRCQDIIDDGGTRFAFWVRRVIVRVTTTTSTDSSAIALRWMRLQLSRSPPQKPRTHHSLPALVQTRHICADFSSTSAYACPPPPIGFGAVNALNCVYRKPVYAVPVFSQNQWWMARILTVSPARAYSLLPTFHIRWLNFPLSPQSELLKQNRLYPLSDVLIPLSLSTSVSDGFGCANL